MKTVLMRTVFNFTKDGSSSHKMNKLIDDFILLRSRLVNIVNPLLKIWNDEYTKPLNLSENGFDLDYERYMISKYQPYIDKINKSLIGKLSSVKLGMDGEICDIIGIDKKDPDQIITLELYPI